VASQVDEHALYGGVVPEIASRRHLENICQVVDQALKKASATWDEIDLYAVSAGPGLAGALLVGLTAAKSYALATNRPLIGVHHVAAHISANYLSAGAVAFPALCLTVSGGHTALLLVRDYADIEQIAATRDDAAGEAFDKTARLLGAGYPGGPAIEKLAAFGVARHVFLPRGLDPALGLDFSFSGLKSAVANYVGRARQRGEAVLSEDLAASVQSEIVKILLGRLRMALKVYSVKTILLAGGVAANAALREGCAGLARELDLAFHVPPLSLCTDNAAMVASSGFFSYQAGARDDLTLNIRTAWPMQVKNLTI
jgi:N6-L-threonylcarbamoyladenine synthase